VAVESARAESLLAFLLLHRHSGQPRQHVAFLLWPDSAESQALTNLRHVLHNLRKAFSELDRHVEVTARTLRWRDDQPYFLDIAAFEDAPVRGAWRDAVECREHGDLERAVHFAERLLREEPLRERPTSP
jgi:DNA-binding SARP family transcriptional activator